MKKRTLIALLLAAAVWIFWGNTAMEVSEWTIESPELPAGFDGFRIVQVSDLHNAEFGEGNERLLELIAEAEPDLIAITGDLVDSRATDVGLALEFARDAMEIAPCYFATGNHERRIGEWEELYAGLIDAGVVVLRDEMVTLERAGDTVTLYGMDDPAFNPYFDVDLKDEVLPDGFKILLSHRAEAMELYAHCGFDLAFGGHAHGGQIRLPFVGGLFAPMQGFFPEYDSGLYREGGTVLLVSRGLGNSLFPVRINNRPELIVAVLKCTQ